MARHEPQVKPIPHEPALCVSDHACACVCDDCWDAHDDKAIR